MSQKDFIEKLCCITQPMPIWVWLDYAIDSRMGCLFYDRHTVIPNLQSVI